MENDRLMRWSRRLRGGLWLAAALLIGAALLRWFAGGDVRVWLPPTLAAEAPRAPLAASLRIAGFCLELLPVAAALYALTALHRICSAYVAGRLFGPEMALLYRAFGKGLLLLGAANGAYTTLVSVLFALSRDAKRLSIPVGLSTADLCLLVVGAAVMMLGFVMEEAHRIERDNAQIV